METLHTLFYFTVAIAVLVAFHEFGHFWVARRVGVKVLRFSIGFGKTLWRWQRTPAATEFVVSAVPLGGYVKMVDEREGEVRPEDLPYAFNRQPLFARTAIVAAGPIFNLLLSVLLFWLVFVIGETGIRPIVGKVEPGTLAAAAGFVERDEIIKINEKLTPTWMEALDTLLSEAISGRQEIDVVVKAADESLKNRLMRIGNDDIQSPEVFQKRLGLKPWMPILRPIVGKLMEDGAAKRAGLESGDLIISADGVAINEWQQWVDYVQARAEIAIELSIERNDVPIVLNITPRKGEQGGKTVGKIGAGVKVPDDLLDSIRVEYTLPPLEALLAALEKTRFYAVSTLSMIGKMFTGSASVDNLSGPISIAQYAGQSAEMGFTAFLKFLGLISVSLGVLNLLPIPVLDGGHLLFYGVEALLRRPISEKVQMYFQQVGMFLLISLMVLAMFLDLGRLIQ